MKTKGNKTGALVPATTTVSTASDAAETVVMSTVQFDIGETTYKTTAFCITGAAHKPIMFVTSKGVITLVSPEYVEGEAQ